MSEASAKLGIWVVARSSRNKSWGDKLCRLIAIKLLQKPPEEDFMRDPLIDEDEGFDPDELERYQRGNRE